MRLDEQLGEPSAESTKKLLLQSMFWSPSYLEKSAWTEHIPFAFWLMEAHRPRVFVELGSHFGTSYFAFCQAAERLGLDTKCFAVDTWEGDEHAGFYDAKVFSQVKAYNDQQYSAFSRLVKSTFDQALPHFTDGSIDLLHIDGLHTFEAVLADFENWLPKLSDRAIVVMHDINVRERNFGVFKVFESLQARYPSFEFVHGHGLGVLGIGKSQNSLILELFSAANNSTEKHAVQKIFSRLGHGCLDAYTAKEQSARAGKLNGELSKLKKEMEELTARASKAKTDLAAQAKELSGAKSLLEKEKERSATERGRLDERAQLMTRLWEEQCIEVKNLREKVEKLPIARDIEEVQESQRVTSERFAGLEASLEQQTAFIKRIEEQTQVKLDGLIDAQNQAHSRNIDLVEMTAKELDRYANEIQQVSAQVQEVKKMGEDNAKVQQERQERFDRREAEDRLLSLKSELQTVAATLAQRDAELAKTAGERDALAQNTQELTTGLETRFQEIARLTQMFDRLQEEKKRSEAERAELQNTLLEMTQNLEVSEEGLQAIARQLARNAAKTIGQKRKSDAFASKFLFRWNGKNKRQRVLEKRVALLHSSGLFDADWYLQRYPDVAAKNAEPAAHYLKFGASENRDPGPLFSTKAYLAANRDVAELKINPLLHFIEHGSKEGRICIPVRTEK